MSEEKEEEGRAIRRNSERERDSENLIVQLIKKRGKTEQTFDQTQSIVSRLLRLASTGGGRE